MSKLIDEIKYDLSFLKSHTLQPKWFKILKVFILFGFLTGYVLLFGWAAMFLFFITFVLLMAVVHFTYRIKTKKYTRNWLDFDVVDESAERKTKRIGKYYYPAIIVNAILSFILSQLLT
jgi:fatty acid desaturase